MTDHSISRRRLLELGGLGVAAGAGFAPALAASPAAAASGTWLKGWGTTVFQEDFSGTGLSSARWNVADATYRNHDWGWLKASNVSVRDGVLSLNAQRMATPRTTADGRRRAWSCAEVTTIGKFSLEHGRWEVRARMPAAPKTTVGLWTAIWLRPDRGGIGGEIDIAETYGSQSSQAKTTFDPTSRSESSVHYNQQRIGTVHGWTPRGTNIYGTWNTWAMEKTPSGIALFFNGQQMFRVDSGTAQYRKAFPSGAAFNLRISYQIGNSYWGQPTAQTVAGQPLELDYVRVWKHQG